MSPARIAWAVVLVAAGAFVASRIVASAQAPAHPDAAPREVLAANPLVGHAFAELAKVESDPARKLELHRIAARRAPRDLEIRAWLFEYHLAAGDPVAAMEQLDVILRLAPREMRKALMPAVVQLSADPAFADALVAAMASQPNWRRPVLGTLRGKLDAPGSALVFAALRESDSLTEMESGQWLNALIRAGHWGEAYSLWASTVDRAPGEPLPMLWNGDFDHDPTEYGFGWRIGRAPGSYTQLEETAGAQGRAARMVFLGRPVATGNLEQPLHIPQGRYRIGMRLMAESLRSDQGLLWELACAGGGKQRFQGEAFNGSFEWREYFIEVDIPVTGCPGQWLRLRNPAPAGAARTVTGELWVDDVFLERAENPS